MQENTNFKSGFVTIAGPPNSGKSTLLNTICNTPLSAVSARPHTTIQHIKGIITKENYQIIFVDTPGFIKPQTKLEKIMKFETQRASKEDADLILLCVEPDLSILEKNRELISLYSSYNKEIFGVITKIDIYPRKNIEEATNFLKQNTTVSCIIEISSIKKTNIDTLIQKVIEKLPYSPPYYPSDILSDKWERFFVTEMIRETIFELYKEEIPYSVAVSIELFKEDTEPVYILAYLYVSKKTHKIILIGEEGKKIKQLREKSQKKIEQILNKSVKLELHVKLKENWQNDDKFIEKILGYQ